MKAKKTNHLLEEADKIEQIPEEKNNGREGQDEPFKAKKSKKNRFLACLRKTWARITGCMRCCCTSIQEERSAKKLQEPNGIEVEERSYPSGINMEEELPEPSYIIYIEDLQDPSEMNMENSKDMFFTAKASTEDAKEESMVENQNIKTDNEEVEVVVTESFVEREIVEEHHRVHALIPSHENLCFQYYTSQEAEELVTEKEIEVEYQHLIGEQLECKVEDDGEVKIKEDEEDGLEKADSAKESQRASSEMPGPSHISIRDNESSKGNENENNQGEDKSIDINKEREKCRSKQISSSRSSSLEEETTEQLYKSSKTSESGSSGDRSDSWSLEEEIQEELYKSIKTILDKYKASLSSTSHDEETSTSDSSLEKLEQPGEETPFTVPLKLESFTSHLTLGEGSSGSGDERCDSCSLEEETLEELYKSNKTSECSSTDDRSDCCSLEVEISEELCTSNKTSQSGSTDDRSDFYSLEEEIPEELNKSNRTSQSGSDDRSDSYWLAEEIPEEFYTSIKTILDKYKASLSSTSHDEEPSTSDSSLEKLEQPGEETPFTVPLKLESFTSHLTLGEGSSGSGDERCDSCSLEEETLEELYKSNKTSECSSTDDRSDCCSLEVEISEELCTSNKTSQSGSTDDRSDFYLLEEEIPGELNKSNKASQSGSSGDKWDSYLLEEEIPEELHKSNKTSQSGSGDNRSYSCSLEEEIPEELHKSNKTSQSGSGDNRSYSCSLEEEIPEELCTSNKTSQSGSTDDRSDFYSLEEEIPEELNKSNRTSQSGSDDRSDSYWLAEEIPEDFYTSIKTILDKYKASQSSRGHDEEPSTSDSCLEKLEQPGEETPSTVPLTLESFTFHQKLGAGGFAEVFLASDIIRKECVAIKVSNKCLFTEDRESFAERNILELSHESPFLIHGLAAFHTEKFVYYVLELATRGDLFDFQGNNFPLDTPTIQFIIAEVICGTQFLHKKHIIHRDLKSENILLTTDGHIKITDFGLAAMGVYERIKEKPRGTPQYLAPEMIMYQKHGQGVDYFAIGVILYDMYSNQFPFSGEDAKEIYHSILHYTPLYPEFLTPDTLDIIEGLLCKDQDYRLGVIGDIKEHPYFSDIKWEDVETRRIKPPAIMTADYVDLNTDQTLDYMEKQIYIRPEDQKIFKEFSFVCPDWSRHYHPVNNQAI